MKTTMLPRFNYYSATLTMVTVALATIMTGCWSTDDKPAKTNPGQIEKIEEIRADANDMVQEMKEFSFAQRAEFSSHFQAQLKLINLELDQLSAKVEKSNETAKAEAQPKLEALRLQVAILNKQLEAVNNASESTWSEVKASISNGYGKVKQGVLDARQWVSEKISP